MHIHAPHDMQQWHVCLRSETWGVRYHSPIGRGSPVTPPVTIQAIPSVYRQAGCTVQCTFLALHPATHVHGTSNPTTPSSLTGGRHHDRRQLDPGATLYDAGRFSFLRWSLRWFLRWSPTAAHLSRLHDSLAHRHAAAASGTPTYASSRRSTLQLRIPTPPPMSAPVCAIWAACCDRTFQHLPAPSSVSKTFKRPAACRRHRRRRRRPFAP